MQRKLLIVTYFFPPVNEIGARRYIGIIEALQDRGWSVTVLTTNRTGEVGTLQYRNSRVAIIRVGHSQTGAETKCTRVDGRRSRKTYFRAARRQLGLISMYIDRTFVAWYIKGVRSSAFDVTAIGKFDAVIASFGPGSSLLIGRRISRMQGIPLVVDFRDLGVVRRGDDGQHTIAVIRWIDRRIEASLMRDSSAILTVSETLAQILRGHYALPTSAIYNGWTAVSPSTEPVSDHVSELASPYMYYAGTIHSHRLPAVELLIRALQDTDWPLYVRCYGDTAGDEVRALASAKAKAGRVHVLPAVSAAKAHQEARDASVNLVFENLATDNEWERGTLTGKLLPMLPMKAPILAIARRDSEIGDILTATRKGKLCSTRAEVREFLDSIKVTAYCGEPDAIELYSKNRQGQKVADVLDALTQPAKHHSEPAAHQCAPISD